MSHRTRERRVLIATTAHWVGDARLNRHRLYLQEAGWDVDLTDCRPRSRAGRVAAVIAVARLLRRERPDVAVLPDPELFVVPVLMCRVLGIRAVIDIHEDYSKVALARDWVPRPLRRLVSWLAWLNTGLGRLLAAATVVAAPELAREGDIVVVNVPRPDPGRSTSADDGAGRVVYIGDVTIQRGCVDMVKILEFAPADTRIELIGPCSDSVAAEIEETADRLGARARVELTGRLTHDVAWGRASGATAGLSLLHPTPAYRDAVGTKVWEYMASGIPPIVTRLPGQAAVVSEIDPSLVVDSPEEAAGVVGRLGSDPGFREEVVRRGLALASSRWEETRPDLRLQEAVLP